jgi:hypothetical protein
LVGTLHLYYKVGAVLRETINIEHGTSIAKIGPKAFCVEVIKIDDRFSVSVKQGIEKADKEVLVWCRSEELLEPEVGVGIHKYLVVILHNDSVLVY